MDGRKDVVFQGIELLGDSEARAGRVGGTVALPHGRISAIVMAIYSLTVLPDVSAHYFGTNQLVHLDALAGQLDHQQNRQMPPRIRRPFSARERL